MTRSKLIKKLDNIFSQYIRLRQANDIGFTECYTCGKEDHWKKLQCGHFMSRKHYSTRWNETNCQVQCSACNVFRYGEQYIFGNKLDKDFGEGTAEDLLIESRQIVKFSNDDIKEKIEYYQKLVKAFS
jgi:hypothetical protein